jgi:hypothetical protein
MYSSEGDLSHILRHEGTNILGDEILAKRFRNMKAEMDTRRMIGYKNKEQ